MNFQLAFDMANKDRRNVIEMGDYVESPQFPGRRGFVNGINNDIISISEMGHEPDMRFIQIPMNLAIKFGFKSVEKWYDRLKDGYGDKYKQGETVL